MALQAKNHQRKKFDSDDKNNQVGVRAVGCLNLSSHSTCTSEISCTKKLSIYCLVHYKTFTLLLTFPKNSSSTIICDRGHRLGSKSHPLSL